MHEVLDGAASADEARELERLVAADPAARAQFEELERLFAGLDAMPQAAPPEGLVTEVLARFPRRSARARLRQLSSRWRVLQPYSGRVRGHSPSRATRSHDSQFILNRRNEDMSGLMSVFSGRRKIWVGGAIALAVFVLAARYFDFPPSREAAGTIAPAKRSLAEQPGASDMNGTGQPDSAGDGRDASRDARVPSRDAFGDSATRDSATRDSATRDSATRDSATRDSATRDSATRDSATRDSATRDSATRDSATRDSATRDSATRDSATRDSATRDSATRDSATRDSATRDSATRDSATRDSATRDSATRDSATRDSATRDSATRDSAMQ